jgi:hypothetical protein
MKTDKSPTGYTLEGNAIGSCGCSVALDCLCWGQEPGGKSCDSFVAYHISRGVIAGIDVSSLTVVRVLREHDQTTLLYVDGNGNEWQQQLLIQAFTGEFGGILNTIHQSFPNHEFARIAPITYVLEQKRASLWISNVLVRRNMQQTPFCFNA